MEKFSTLNDCIALAEFAHRNQVDQAGMPYIDHPRRVMQTVQAQGAMPYVQMAAILHDVTEDTTFTISMLLELGIAPAAVELIKLLDRGYSEHYYFHDPTGPLYAQDGTKEQKNYFYYADIRTNKDATLIKLADINDNLQPWRLSYLSQSRQEYLTDKYDKALKALKG